MYIIIYIYIYIYSVITLLITIVFIQLEHVNKNPLLCLRSRNSGETRSTKQKEKTLIFHILIIYREA